MIGGFYKTLFSIERMQWVDDKSSEIAVGSFHGHLQQASSTLTISLADTITLSHSIWCDINTDVKKGDRLYANGFSYVINQIFKYDTGGNQHLELYVERDEKYASV